MFKSISLAEMMNAIMANVETNTGIQCYNAIPAAPQEPYYYLEIIEKTPLYSKTIRRDSFVVRFHAMPINNQSMAPTYDMLHRLEEALGQEIELPEGFDLFLQQSNGIQKLEIEEFKETRTVAIYNFVVCCTN